MARLAQSAERKALNLVVVGSSPTVGGVGLGEDVRGTGYLGGFWPGAAGIESTPACLPIYPTHLPAFLP